MTIVAIAVGGALGALARYGVALGVQRRADAFPLGTLVVNVTGSFVLGLLFVTLMRAAVHPALRAGAMIGFLGAYTTFSTFSLETVRLLEEGSWGMAVTNIVASVVAALVVLYVGLRIGRAL